MDAASVPQDIIALAEERSAARIEHDWARADQLKAQIEIAGWRVVDQGPSFTLRAARPSDMIEHGQTLYGSLESVPSRLEEPASTRATVVVISADGASPDGALEALAKHRPDDTQVLVVAERGIETAAPADELVRTTQPFSAGDALQAALRCSTGHAIIVLKPDRIVRADIVTPLVDGLRDASVAIIGSEGLVSGDLHRYEPAGNGEATTVASGCYAFRRDDAIARGPIDGRLQLGRSVAAWLGLLLRDEGEARPPRRAQVIGLPLDPTKPAEAVEDEGGPSRLARRDGYRIADRFRDHGWLAGDQPPQGRLVGDGAHGHDQHDDADDAGHAHEA